MTGAKRTADMLVENDHLVSLVFMHAPPATLAHCATVCRQFKQLTQMPLAVRCLDAQLQPCRTPWPAALTSLSIGSIHSARNAALPSILWLLGHLHQLRSLEFDAWLFSEDAVVEVLHACAHLTSLTGLRLTNAVLQTSGPAALAAVLPCLPGLRHLTLHVAAVADLDFSRLQPALLTLSHLTALYLSSDLRCDLKVSAAELSHLLTRSPSLCSLTLSPSAWTRLTSLTDLDTLWRSAVHLEAFNPGILHGPPAQALAHVLPSLTRLRALDLSCTCDALSGFEDSILHLGLVRAVASLTQLTLLFLRGHGATYSGDPAVLRDMLWGLTQLRALDISCSTLYRQSFRRGLQLLAPALARVTSLTYLGLHSFRGAQISPAGAWAEFLVHLPALRELRMSVASDFNWMLLRQCSELSRLVITVLLPVSRPPAHPLGLDKCMQGLPALQVLELDYEGRNKLPDIHSACMAMALQGLAGAGATLTQLELDNDGGDGWVTACQQLCRLTQLQHLVLSMGGSTVAEMCALAAGLRTLSALTHLAILGLFGDDKRAHAARDPSRHYRPLPVSGVGPLAAHWLGRTFAFMPRLLSLCLGGCFNTEESILHVAAGLWHLTGLTYLELYMSDGNRGLPAGGSDDTSSRSKPSGDLSGCLPIYAVPHTLNCRCADAQADPPAADCTHPQLTVPFQLPACVGTTQSCLQAALSRLRRLVALTLKGRFPACVCAALPCMRALTSLRMQSVHVPDSSHLGLALASMQQLGTLTIQHSSLGGAAGFEGLAKGLSTLTALSKLVLCEAGLCGASVRRLGELLQGLGGLQDLDIGQNGCTPYDLKAMLSGLTALTRLVRLEVPSMGPEEVEETTTAMQRFQAIMPAWFSWRFDANAFLEG